MLKRTCVVSGEEFVVTDADLLFNRKMGIPAPKLCPQERQRRRIAYRNFRSLYRRACDATGKKMISMYHADQPFPVYENSYWWGDEWDVMEYGQEVDLERSVFEQYHDLAMRVPRFAIYNINCDNCLYSNFAWMSKDCYLVAGCVRDEACLYGHIVWDSKDCVDCLYVFRCEWCSECVDCVDCYDLHFSTECSACHESYFLHDCRGCKNCFGCTNLRNKEYYFMNEKLTKEEYHSRVEQLKPFKRETLKMGRDWLEKTKKEDCAFPPFFSVKCEDCTGDHVYESKNCQYTFDAKGCEDSAYLYTAFGQQNCRDISFTGGTTQHCVECLTMHNCVECRFSHGVFASDNLDYCEFCYECQDCFGCNGLRNKQYCIFNKQYTSDEYVSLRDQLIQKMRADEEWGEFFPIANSPFAYNESVVQEYQPLDKQQVLERGLRWRESEEGGRYDGPVVAVPDTIDGVEDAMIDQVFACRASKKSYRILKQELDFYRRVGLPLPDFCPDHRHEVRMRLRNPRELWKRTCAETGVEIESSFAPDRPEKVLCEECYLQNLN